MKWESDIRASDEEIGDDKICTQFDWMTKSIAPMGTASFFWHCGKNFNRMIIVDSNDKKDIVDSGK